MLNRRFLIVVNILLVALVLISLSVISRKPDLKTYKPNYNQALSEAKAIVSSCLSEQDCYLERLSNLVEKSGILAAQDTLVALQTINSDIRSCHGMAHRMARQAILKDPSRWKELLSEVNPTICGGGLMHGVIEAHMSYDPNFVLDTIIINGVCSTSQCVHTFGHIALLQTMGDIASALPVCDKLPEKFSLECFNGLFMEDSTKTNLLEHGVVKSAPNPGRDPTRFAEVASRCIKYSGPAAQGCWADLGPIFDEYYNYNYERVYNACQKANTEAEQRHCYFRAAASIAIYEQVDTAQELVSICSPYTNARTNAYERCIVYLASSLIYNSTNFMDRANLFCSEVPTKFQEICFTAVGEMLKQNTDSNDQRIAFCEPIAEQFRDFCVNGNQDKTKRFSSFSIF